MIAQPISSSVTWTRDAVLYQIFCDRFSRGHQHRHTRNGFVPWNSRPTAHNFMGGTLQGIRERFDYLKDLGVTLLYLTPIFLASSNHRYNTYDYFTIDPRLGSLQDFRRFVDTAHARGIRIILDGVFNHCGRGFFPFHDVMENDVHSPFIHWFHINQFPVRAYGQFGYRGWQERPVLPILNLNNSETRRYFLNVVNYWTKQGIDGWRLDAVADVKGHRFWKELWHEVKAINPSAYLLAEIWGPGRKWVKPGQFDGGTNYLFRETALAYLIHRTIPKKQFLTRLKRLLQMYPWEQTLSMVNVLGSHDTERLYTLAQGNIDRLKLTILFSFVFPGIPAIYYGDEIGMPGGKDPDNRRGMQWNPTRWNDQLRTFTKRMIGIRKSLYPLRHGDWTVLPSMNSTNNLCLFLRRAKHQRTLILIHNQDQSTSVQIDIRQWFGQKTKKFIDHVSGGEYLSTKGILRLDQLSPNTGMILTTRV